MVWELVNKLRSCSMTVEEAEELKRLLMEKLCSENPSEAWEAGMLYALIIFSFFTLERR